MQRERVRPFSSAPLKAITGREGILDPVQCGYKVSGRTNTIAKAAHCVATAASQKSGVGIGNGEREGGANETSEANEGRGRPTDMPLFRRDRRGSD